MYSKNCSEMINWESLRFFDFFIEKYNLGSFGPKKCQESEKNNNFCFWQLFRNIFTIKDPKVRKKSWSEILEKKTFLESGWNSLFKNITFICVRPRNRKNVTPFFYVIIFVSWCLFSAFRVDSVFLENLKIDSAGDFRAKEYYILLYQLGHPRI